MKRFLQVCSIVVMSLLLFTPITKASDYSELYVLITDAIINTNQQNEEQAQQALQEIEQLWATYSSEQVEAKAEVDHAIKAVMNASDAASRVKALSQLSKALSALDLAENPIDEKAERESFYSKFSPFMTQWEEAYVTNDTEKIQEAYKMLDAKWNQYEKPVRAQSIGLYGQIESQLAFMRIALSNETPDIALANSYFTTLKSHIEQFMAGEDIVVEDKGYSLQTLVDLMDDALKAIEQTDYEVAADALTQFIIVWPNVEIEISTRNSSLYNKLESDIPILVSRLSQTTPKVEEVVAQLETFKKEIQLIQSDDSYSFWDSALILLREGLEAILIIMVLVSFLKRSNQERMVKWIYSGAVAGVLLSAGMAILLAIVFDSLTSGTNREMIEGWVGLAAAIMMIGVGVWLHSKSTVQSWNTYLSKQMGHAISKGSVLAMAFISFLSVFREGAETILFYAGIIPKIEIFDFVLGIVIAIIILIIVALALTKLSGKIPIHKFFFVATIMIYILAFKIIGTSIHTLQLTDVVSTNVVDVLPVMSAIGFYPTVETILGQAILLFIWAFVSWKQRKHS
ncbi:FTR1 family protein [Lysinibacillus sp. KU-BSD001]|uniref:FTR1 family iron permease n=1 Tax=Lysinibacillus sp. KU-BSD001 TaxID=3141328 RepID=UPI0036E9C719